MTSFLTTVPNDQVMITGTRVSITYGENVTRDLAIGMTDEERLVASCGAYEVEGTAHRVALAGGGHTIAVLAGGLVRPQLAGHSDLLRKIGDVSLLVNELSRGASPTNLRFTARNRTMDVLSGATVVCEAELPPELEDRAAVRVVLSGALALPGVDLPRSYPVEL